MPNLNRRGFLQLLGATSAAPLVPLAPAKAAIAQTSTSKALWTSLYAKAGSKAEFVGLSRNLGLSNAAIEGVSARTIGVRVAASTLAQPLSPSRIANVSPPSEGLPRLRINIKSTLEKYFWDDDEDNHELQEQKSEDAQLDETATSNARHL